MGMSTLHLILTAIFLPLLAAPLPALLAPRMKSGLGYLVLIVPMLSCLCIVLAGVQAGIGVPTALVLPWFPAAGINLNFLLDGLSFFFALVVSGMGILIVFYAKHYMEGHYAFVGRFYSYLLFFMAAMLGTVLADNLMLMFVFWELTGISSFLLIGFSHDKPESRYGARMALLVTVFTGLLMLVGVVLVGLLSGGVYDVSVLSKGRLEGVDPWWVNLALLLMLCGAFGKSAQFPLHFWLPNAMAAPTPVSAYLHSATMVKLGVFLCARLFPVFSEYELWQPLLIIVGATTMLLGAILALLSNDLKAILAFATVNQLGALVCGYGVGAAHGVQHDFLQIMTHVFYKGGLFMMAGIIDHAVGTRDIRQLGGLRRRMPWLTLIFGLATASMMGLPPTVGFISKEVSMESYLYLAEEFGAAGWVLFAVLLLSFLFKILFSCRLFFRTFFGPECAAATAHFHRPSMALQLPATLLAFAGLTFGLLPGVPYAIDQALAVPGLQAEKLMKLTLWHGFTPLFWTTVVLFATGFGLYALLDRTRWGWVRIPIGLRFDLAFDHAMNGMTRLALWITRLLQHEKPLAFLPILFGFTGLLLIWGLATRITPFEWEQFLQQAFSEDSVNLLRSFFCLLIAGAALGVVFLRHWSAQLISLSIAGFLITFFYVLYQAPDLAMTQILIETVTLILVLILFNRFYRETQLGETERQSSPVGQRVRGALAVVSGGVVTLFILLFTGAPERDPMGHRFLEESEPLAHGTNTVNTILVDFRGFDTLGEATVLVIATLGCMGLIMRRRSVGQKPAVKSEEPA